MHVPVAEATEPPADQEIDIPEDTIPATESQLSGLGVSPPEPMPSPTSPTSSIPSSAAKVQDQVLR